MLASIFRPGRIGSLELPNRIIMGAMHLGMEAERDATALAAFYVERARGEAAMIITGGSAVNRVGAGGRHYSFINEVRDEAKWPTVVGAVHREGGLIALQLFHAGRYGSKDFFGLEPIAPSAVASRFSKSQPREMSSEEIAETIDDFARGAVRARDLGFDAVELMGSEGYLLNQFVSPLTNLRQDEWGGDFERRTHFPRVLMQAVRRAVGRDFPVIYRISAADLMPGSTSDEETCALATVLRGAGVDALDVGLGWHESSVPTVQFAVPPAAWMHYAEMLKSAVGDLPVIAGTRINSLELAERALAAERADFISMARPFLADPKLVAKARAGLSDRTNVCIACNQACIDRSLSDQAVSCMVNPRAGRELELREDVPSRHRGIFAVVGGGPAGLEAARVLATLGHKVVLYEADRELGGQFRLARRIPGKQEFGRTIAYFEGELRRLGVEIRLEEPIERARIDVLDAYDGVIVASGVVPRKIDLPGAELAQVCAYPDAMLGKAGTDGPVAIIGGGGIGVDVAHLLCSAGRNVTLLCRDTVVARHVGRSTRWVTLRSLKSSGVRILTAATCERIVTEGVWITDCDGERRLIAAQSVVVAVGQECNDALGDALRLRGRRFCTIGGAHRAGRLDAVRAFLEGAQAAHVLADACS